MTDEPDTAAEAGVTPVEGSSGPAVALKGLRKTYGGVAAVERMDVEIADREFFSMIGPSGCGKTTTLRMIAGFEVPTSGEVHIEGQPMANVPPYRRPVNYVFQNYALFPHMTVAENVGYSLRVRGSSRHQIATRVGEALAMVQLSEISPLVGFSLVTSAEGFKGESALHKAFVPKPDPARRQPSSNSGFTQLGIWLIPCDSSDLKFFSNAAMTSAALNMVTVTTSGLLAVRCTCTT